MLLKPLILYIILCVLLTSLPLTFTSLAQGSSTTTSCPNGLSQYTNKDLGSFSFCYDSATTVTSNIGPANGNDKDNHYELTISKSINKVGSIELTKNDRKLVCILSDIII
jgi:hypothetical protein